MQYMADTTQSNPVSTLSTIPMGATQEYKAENWNSKGAVSQDQYMGWWKTERK